MQTETKELGITVNFTIDLDEKQDVLSIFQKSPIASNYELNLVNSFNTDENGKISGDELNDYVRDSCLSFIHDQSIIGKILMGLDYSITIKDMRWEPVH